MTVKALAQWRDSDAAIRDGLKRAGVKRRHRFADLTFDSFSVTKPEGRKFGYYWDESEKRKYIYRYQWVWIMANGAIARGMTVHHINGDCTDDRIENLQLLSNEEHSKLHMTPAHLAKMLAAQPRPV